MKLSVGKEYVFHIDETGEEVTGILLGVTDTSYYIHLTSTSVKGYSLELLKEGTVVTPSEEGIDMQYDSRPIFGVTKEITFDSCHKLLNYKGKCANLHGHTYKLQVTVQNTVDDIGMAMDFKFLKEIMNEFKDLVDHKYLNEVFSFQTTAENMVGFIVDFISIRLSSLYPNEEHLKVAEVKLWETPTSYASWKVGE